MPSAPAVGGYACAALENSSAVVAFAVSFSGELLAANAKMAALVGAKSGKDLVGASLADFMDRREGWEPQRRACLAGEGRGVSLVLKGSGGQRIILKGDLDCVQSAGEREERYIFGVFTDVSEEHKLRQAVQRSARMEALGSLTSGIAHDFNNLLTVLVGNLYLVGEELRDNSAAFEKLKSARDAAKRGADLIRQLLAFARREVLDTDVVDPVKVIEGLVPLLRRALGSRVVLETKLQRECGSMQCNAGQLESVIVNLSVNARDAINAKDAKCGTGHVLISAEPMVLAAHDAGRRGIEPGAYFRISVADDGCGMPEAVLRRAFEPFFSTKGEQGGTGLGLSMVRWFAEQAGGTAYVKSALGKGTIVSLFLPRLEGATVSETTTKTMPLSQLPTGDETILVLSREEALCSTIKQILEVLGYEVRISGDPQEALRLLHGTEVDMLLVDAAVQHASVREAWLRQARAARPRLKLVIAADGGGAGQRAADSVGAVLLSKPFSLADLADAVRRALAVEPDAR